jgi:phage regulator Rha-like protein
MYAVETKQLKRAVRRNIDRFPNDFMFQLSNEEYRSLRRQFGTLKRGAHSKYPPMAFTEQGVAMLSSVLNSQRAIEVNIAIIRAFVHLRKMIASHKELAKRLKELEHHIKDHDEKIQAIFEAIQQLITLPGKSQKKIGFTAKEAQKSYGKKPTEKKQPTRKSAKK